MNQSLLMKNNLLPVAPFYLPAFYNRFLEISFVIVYQELAIPLGRAVSAN